MKNTARALSGARRVLDALRLVSEVGVPAPVRLAHTAAHTAASPRYDIQPSLRPGVGVLTWLLQSNLSAAERRALARELDPVLAHTQPAAAPVLSPVTQPAPPKVQPVLSPPKAQPVPLQQRQEQQQLAVATTTAARAVEHPVLGTLLYDFGYKRVRPPARPCAAPVQD